jgi:glycosyltransferase involved in cell wall biosynthesis
MTKVSVIIAVYNRDRDLRRALQSVIGQSLTDFECIVIDDASTIDIRTIVESFGDSRLRFVRREVNGGPSAARIDGYRAAQGEYVVQLDSDWEFFPWALERACYWLDTREDVDMACALHLRDEDSRMFVRVRDAPRLVTPEQFRHQEPLPDRISAVRRKVVLQWLELPGDYFALEAHQWISAELSHNQVALDEPWVLYHTQGADRITVDSSDARAQRALDDYVTFLRERNDLIDGGTCKSVDWVLKSAYLALRRAKRPEAGLAAQALERRGISASQVLARSTATRVAHKLRLRRRPAVSWLA